MSKILLNNKIGFNLPKLIESRLLVQANSGGGKSYANRKIIEEAFGQVQIIIIDPEGEFGNMRGEYDFLYIGKDGDAPAESRSAALLVRKLLETKASAIVDIYEMNMTERRHFVKLFFEAMVNAPKELWHDVLIILDEAHKFAPEKEHAESLEAVADMASRGRKRGYCLIPATQRPAKLNKDVAAECNNKLIGRASLDIDRKRSAEELGFTTKEEILSLRNLEPGEFYVFGPAISKEVVKIKIGDVKVKPAVRGGKKSTPAPTEKVKKILAQFKDLPQEARKEAETLADLKQQIKTLTHQVRTQKTVTPPQVIADPKAIEKAVKTAVVETEKRMQEVFWKERNQWLDQIQNWFSILEGIGKGMKEWQKQNPRTLFGSKMTYDKIIKNDPRLFVGVDKGEESGDKTVITKIKVEPYAHKTKPMGQVEVVDSFELTGPEKKILNALAWCESIGIEQAPQEMVAFLSGYMHHRSTGYTNPRGYLKTKGCIEYSDGKIWLTETGRQIAEAPRTPLTQEELHQAVLARLPGPEQKLLIPLLENPEGIENARLCEIAGYAHERSTGYTNPRGKLKSFGLVEYANGIVKAKDFLFI